MTAAYRVRTMRREELDFAVKLATNEGWNPGVHDADAFFATDPGGFLIGLLDEVPIGCISAVCYGSHFGFLGFYIVVPEYRGRGYGRRLWRNALERFGARNIGLDGVEEQQEHYRKSGFSLAYGNIRYVWTKRSQGAATITPNIPILPVGNVDADSLARYDRLCFPAPRTAFLDAWFKQPGSATFVWRDSTAIRGYGMIRPSRDGWRVGPLLADSREIAESLLRALSREAPDDAPVYLDVPDVNIDGLRLAADLGMNEVFGTARMYSGQPPEIATDRIFGVTTFELG